jgi:ribosome-associated protein
MLRISRDVAIPEHELEITTVRAAGPGGQHGDKASTAVHLRFDIRNASLPAACRRRLLARADDRITREGVIVIKAQEYRSRERNVESARERLRALVHEALTPARPRRPTAPSRTARRRRTDRKKQRGRTKALRKPPETD